jgi:two-component system NarL family sensor kinase
MNTASNSILSPGNALMIFIFGTILIVSFVFALIYFLLRYKRKQQVYIAEKLQLKYGFRQELLQSRLEVQEQSLQYFSEEIHDNIGQVLTLCKLHMHELAEQQHDERAKVLADQSRELLTQALSDLRSISHTMNNNYIGRSGLIEAIKKELNTVGSMRKVQTALEIKGELASLGAEKELLIFRIMQESISNALKHASPTQVSVVTNYEHDGLTIKIKDDGCGFDTNKMSSADGIGLNNMQVRTALLKGSIQFVSSAESGTEITLKIPYHG